MTASGDALLHDVTAGWIQQERLKDDWHLKDGFFWGLEYLHRTLKGTEIEQRFRLNWTCGDESHDVTNRWKTNWREMRLVGY